MNKAQQFVEKINNLSSDEKEAHGFDPDWWIEENLGDAKTVESEITGTGRWDTFYESVTKFDDGSYAGLSWVHGSTEYQDNTEPNYEAWEVEPYETTVTKYKRKELK